MKTGRYLAGRKHVFTVAGPLQEKDSLLRNESNDHFTCFQTIQFMMIVSKTIIRFVECQLAGK